MVAIVGLLLMAYFGHTSNKKPKKKGSKSYTGCFFGGGIDDPLGGLSDFFTCENK